MSFLGNLGIDGWLLLAQLVNFGLLVFLLTKFVYRPIIARIEKDEQELAQVRAESDSLKEKADLLHRKEIQQEVRLKKQAKTIIEEAEEIAVDITNRAHLESQQEKEAVIAQIKQKLSELDYDQNS